MAKTSAWRIVVALDAARHDPAGLEAATLLAAHKQAEMLALFVEDLGLFHLAELPFAIELGRGGEAGRSLDAGRLQRLLRGQIERLRQELEQAAIKQRISLSQRTVRGRFLPEALGAAEGVDVLFLCRGGECRVALGRVGAPLARGGERAPVCALYDASPAASRALHVAGVIAEAENRPLAVLLPTDQEAEAESWRRRAMESGDLRQNASQFIVIAPERCGNVSGDATVGRCQLLVAARDDRKPPQTTLAGTARCPVALVS